MSHHSLADVLNAFVRTGLAIEHVAGLGDRSAPSTLAMRARKGPRPMPGPTASVADLPWLPGVHRVLLPTRGGAVR